jgi:hypothetical protein
MLLNRAIIDADIISSTDVAILSRHRPVEMNPKL